MPNFSGIWTRTQQMQARGASTWPAVPGAPTIGTATAGGSLCASVTFTAPACAGYPATITAYRVISTPGCFTNTGASSPVVVSGLTNGTSYTFKVAATNSTGYGACSAASNSITGSNAGSQSYTTAGTYSWVAPAGVTSVSVVTVGGGGGGGSSITFSDGGGGGAGGGELRYKNNISVTSGSTYTVVVGASGVGQVPNTSQKNGGQSSFNTTTVIANGGQGGSANNSGTGGSGGTGDGGGNGGTGSGSGGGSGGGGGGGAGGYAGAGGNGAFCGGSGTAGNGGGAGGGGGSSSANGSGGGGGGVGILGQGSSGASAAAGTGGRGGSGGANGTLCIGGAYGGGGGGARTSGACGSPAYTGKPGANGAVRIIWPGATRSFPSTNAGSP